MKTPIACLLLCIMLVPQVHGQSTSGADFAPPAKGPIGIGPFLTMGAAVNAGNVQSGYKTAPRFSYSIGATSDIPLTPTIAFDLGLGYDARGINFHDFSNEDKKVDYTFGYITVSPAFRFSDFIVGVDFGIPFNSSADIGKGLPAAVPSTSNMNTLIELRLGAVIPLADLPNGKINFLLFGSYAFNKIYTDAYQLTTGFTDHNNGPLASLEIGASYMFDATKRQ